MNNRRKARSVWYRWKNAADKRKFNRKSSNRTNRKIKEYNQNCFEKYLSKLCPEVDKDYSLWKATGRFKRPIVRVPPIKNAQNR